MISIQSFLNSVQPRQLKFSYLLRWWSVRFLISALNLMELENFVATLASSPPSIWSGAKRTFFLLRTLAITLQVAAAVIPLVSIAFFERHHIALNVTIVAIGALSRALTAFCPQLAQRRAHLIADVLLYLVHQDELGDYIPQVFAMVALYGMAPLMNWLAAVSAKMTGSSVPRFDFGNVASSTVPLRPGSAAAAGPTAGLSEPLEELIGSLAIMVGAVAAYRAYRTLVGDKEQDFVLQRGHARGTRDGDGGCLRVREPVSFIRRPSASTWASTLRSPGTVRSWALALHHHQQHHQHYHRVSLPGRLGNGGDGGTSTVVGATNGGVLNTLSPSPQPQPQPLTLSRTFAWRVLAVAVLHGQALVATIAAHYARGVGPPAAALAVHVVSVLALAAGAAASMHRPRWQIGVNGFCFSGVAFLVLSQAILLSHMAHMGIPPTGVGGDGGLSVSSPSPSRLPNAKLGGGVGTSLCCSLAITTLTLLSVSGSRSAIKMHLLAITFALHMATLLGAVRSGTIGGSELGANDVDGEGASVLMTLVVLLRRMLSALPASPLIIYLLPLLVPTIFSAVNLPKWVSAGKSAVAVGSGKAVAEQLKLPMVSTCKAHDKQQQPSRQHRPQQMPTYDAEPHCIRDRLRQIYGSYGPGGYGGVWLVYRPRSFSSCPGSAATMALAGAPPSPSPTFSCTRDQLARSRALAASSPARPCPTSSPSNGDDGVVRGSCSAGGVGGPSCGSGLAAQVAGAGAGTEMAAAAKDSLVSLSPASSASLAGMLAAAWVASAKKGWNDTRLTSSSVHMTEICSVLGHAPAGVSTIKHVEDHVLHSRDDGADDVCVGGSSSNGYMGPSGTRDGGSGEEFKAQLDVAPAKYSGFWSISKGPRTGNRINAATSRPASQHQLKVLGSYSRGSDCIVPSSLNEGKDCDDNNNYSNGARSGSRGGCCDGGSNINGGGVSGVDSSCCDGRSGISGGGISGGDSGCCNGGGYVSIGGEDVNLHHGTGCCTGGRSVGGYSTGDSGGGAGIQSQSLNTIRGASKGTAAAITSTSSSCPPAPTHVDNDQIPPSSPPRRRSFPSLQHFDHHPQTEEQSDCSLFASTPAADDDDDANSVVTRDSWGSHKRMALAAAATAAATPAMSAVSVPSMTATMPLPGSHLSSRWSKMRTVSAQLLRLRSPSATTEESPPTTSQQWRCRQASYFSRSFIKYWRSESSSDNPDGACTVAMHSSPVDSSLSSATSASTDPWAGAGSLTMPTPWCPATIKHPRTTTTKLQALDASKVFKSSRKSYQGGSGNCGGGSSNGCGGHGIVPVARHSLSSWSPYVSGSAFPGEICFPLEQPNVPPPVGGVSAAVTSSVPPCCSPTARQNQEATAAAMETAAGSRAVAAKLGLVVPVVESSAPTCSALEKAMKGPSAILGTITLSGSVASSGGDAAVESPAAAGVAGDDGCSRLTSGSCIPRSLWKCASRQASSTGSGKTFAMDPAVARSGNNSDMAGDGGGGATAGGGTAAAAAATATTAAAAAAATATTAAAVAAAAEPAVGPTQTEDEQTLEEDQLWIALEVSVVVANTMDALPKFLFGGGSLSERLLSTSAICMYCMACLAHAAALFSPHWAPDVHRRRQLLHCVRHVLCRLLLHGALALAGHEHRVTPLRAWSLVGGLWALLRLRQRLFLQLFPLAAAAYYVVHELRHWQTSTPYVRLYDLMRFHLDPLLSYVITGSAMLGLAWLLRRLRSTAASRRALAYLGCFPEPGRFAQGVMAFAIALQFIPQLIVKQACLMSWLAGQLERLGFGRLLMLASPTHGSQNSDLAVGAVVVLFLCASALQALVLRLPFLQSPRYVWYCKQHVKVLSFMDAVMQSDQSVAAILAAFKAATAEAFAGLTVNVALLVAEEGENGDGEYGKEGVTATEAAAGASVALHRIHESAVSAHYGGGGLSSRRDAAAAAAAVASVTVAAATAAAGLGSAGAFLGDNSTLESPGPIISRAASGSTPEKRQQVQVLPLSAVESLSYATSQRLIVFTNDYSTSTLLFQDWTEMYQAGTGVAMMAVPLVFNGRDLGALEIVCPRPDVFDEQLRRVVVEFATQLGQALYNKVVEHEASVGNRLLLQIMPSAVAEQVKRQVFQHGLNDAPEALSAGASETIVYKHWHPQVSVLFADVLGYTQLSCEVEPEVVMLLLHVLFAKLDALCEQYGCYKVNTIGDCYIACTGLLVEVEDHAQQLVDFGKALLQACSEVDNPLGGKIEMRVGINSGRVMSGIVGRTRPHFTLYGDCVNTASRMESTGIPGTIQITGETYLQLGEQERARWGERRSVQVKGKGTMQTYIFQNQPGLAALAAEEQAAAGAVNSTNPCPCPSIFTWDHPLKPDESWDVSWEI